ncbi:hypothetical protein N7535_001590 [Penicillium sp. DV-2018c]|nr:hypothetical protein N7461_005167 [Penicillium sp. DV-2018c]KAJ5582970.1 hypothetical protein N7535_001590 [Penicillium sp. DV-2018c]
MKLSTSFPLLLAAATVQASPALPNPLALATSFTRIYHELDKINLANCTLANLSMPLNSTTKPLLPAPSTNLTLKYVALGRGTQNYTCPPHSLNSSNTTIEPVATGAVATLFDASCIAASSLALLHEVPAIISKTPLESLAFMAALVVKGTRSNAIILGEHHFSAAGDPVFDLSLSGADSWIATSKLAAAPAPNTTLGSVGDVPWLKLGYKKGSGIQEVYRVVTSQGDPPSTCVGQNATIQVEYAAEYWFYGR